MEWAITRCLWAITWGGKEAARSFMKAMPYGVSQWTRQSGADTFGRSGLGEVRSRGLECVRACFMLGKAMGAMRMDNITYVSKKRSIHELSKDIGQEAGI